MRTSIRKVTLEVNCFMSLEHAHKLHRFLAGHYCSLNTIDGNSGD